MQMGSPCLIRRSGKGFHELHLRIYDIQELFLNLFALPGEPPVSVFARDYRYWEDYPTFHIVRQQVWGRLGPTAERGPLYCLDDLEWPGSWTQSDHMCPGQIFGIQAHAVCGLKVRRLNFRDRIVGVVYEDEWAKYCVLSGLRPENVRQTAARQVSATLDFAEAALTQADLAFKDVYRTWFYLNNPLEWDEFKDARDAFFRSRGIFARLMPVSTEFGAGNRTGAAMVAGFLAMRPKCAEARCFEVKVDRSGSGASNTIGPSGRAIGFNIPGQCRLFVSATSGMETAENPIPAIEATAQVAHTRELVQNLLGSQGMGWSDVVRGLRRFSRPGCDSSLEDRCAAQRLARWPVLAIRAEPVQSG